MKLIFIFLLTTLVSCVEEISLEDLQNETFVEKDSFAAGFANSEGAKLYAVHCMSCHYDLSISTKKNRSAERIELSIKEEPKMIADKSLALLTKAQIQAISQALSIRITPPPSSNTVTENQKYMIGTRRFVASKLMHIFYEQDKEDATKKIIDDNILNDSGGLFGGNCSILDLDCKGTMQVKSSGIMLPNSHPIRSAVLYNTCQQVLERNKAISSALKAADLTIDSSADNAANIADLFDVFYPGISITNEVSDDLREIYKNAIANNINNTDAWKLVMSPMCKSALFEAF